MAGNFSWGNIGGALTLQYYFPQSQDFACDAVAGEMGVWVFPKAGRVLGFGAAAVLGNAVPATSAQVVSLKHRNSAGVTEKSTITISVATHKPGTLLSPTSWSDFTVQQAESLEFHQKTAGGAGTAGSVQCFAVVQGKETY